MKNGVLVLTLEDEIVFYNPHSESFRGFRIAADTGRHDDCVVVAHTPALTSLKGIMKVDRVKVLNSKSRERRWTLVSRVYDKQKHGDGTSEAHTDRGYDAAS